MHARVSVASLVLNQHRPRCLQSYIWHVGVNWASRWADPTLLSRHSWIRPIRLQVIRWQSLGARDLALTYLDAWLLLELNKETATKLDQQSLSIRTHLVLSVKKEKHKASSQDCQAVTQLNSGKHIPTRHPKSPTAQNLGSVQFLSGQLALISPNRRTIRKRCVPSARPRIWQHRLVKLTAKDKCISRHVSPTNSQVSTWSFTLINRLLLDVQRIFGSI
jgi:hypothetical protein